MSSRTPCLTTTLNVNEVTKSDMSPKLDNRLRRLLREAKRNPVAEEMHKYHKPKTHKQRKRSFKDIAFDDLNDWKDNQGEDESEDV